MSEHDRREKRPRILFGPLLAAACAALVALASAAGLPAATERPAAAPAAPSDLARGFRDVPNDARLRMYWRVFGPAWTEPEIDRQLALIKDAGLGGVTVYFLYPVALDDPARGIVNQRFGSPEFLRAFAYAARRARALGLRFSVNAGTGWPYGGPTVGPTDAAQRLKEVRAAAGADPKSTLKLADGERLVAAFLGQRDATEDAAGGRLPSPLPADLRAYIAGPTGMQVKRPSFGGEGAVLDHYDTPALLRWLEANVRPLLEAAPGLIEGIGCDSLEVYRANWAPELPDEFRTRRGYDLLPRLPELFDDASAARRLLRFDLWRTLAELTEERFTAVLGDWCAKRGVGLEMEPYGIPPSPMTAASHISTPTGEHYEWQGYAVQRYVASMSHLAGRNVVGAEAWTWAGLPNRLGDSLSDLKLVSDMTFLLGANDLTGVDFPYSPRDAGAPGWLPYYGPVMGEANPQWKLFPALVGYLNRCQWMLRQGTPVRKVAVYLPVEDALSGAPADQIVLDFEIRDRLATGRLTSEFGLKNALRHRSDLAHGLIRAGYDYDGLDFWAVSRLARTGAGGRLDVGAASYEAIILPGLEFMDAGALEKIAAFCRAGGTAVASGRLPAHAPGLGRERDERTLRRLVAEIFGESPAAGAFHACGRGGGIFVADPADAARALAGHVDPDLKMTPPPESVGFVHRRLGDGRDVYFLANVGPDAVELSAEPAGPPRRIEIWDAFTGRIRVEAARSGSFKLSLPGRGSTFVVVGGATADAEPAPPVTGRATDRRELALDWWLSFEGPDPPPPAVLRELKSWTDLPGGAFFSGTGTYRAKLDWTEALPARCDLRFDQVREAAEVRLNGRALGVVFAPYLAVDLAPALRQGRNDLEIAVVNLPLNRFLGQPDPDLGPLRARYGNRFPDPEEKKSAGGPAPSGLLGRIWLECRRE